MARCGCGSACGCSLTSNAAGGTTVTGAGSPANPWQVAVAIKNCADVRSCLTGNQGVTFNPATGVISACVSPNAGNGLTRDVNGCLFVGAGASTVTTGCGVTGTGTPASPVAANVTAWPYACPIGTAAGVVSCDPATGKLWGEPRSHSMVGTQFYDTNENITVAAGATQSNMVKTFTTSVTNGDTCNASTVIGFQELDIVVTLPANARVEYGMDNDNMVQHTNRGATTETDFHIQVSKALPRGTIAPGATASYTFNAFAGLGTNGAVITQISAIFRLLLITA